MTSLVYAPSVTVRIFSTKLGKTVDVSEDCASGSVTRVVNGVSTAEFTLLNRGRKYEGLFSPMDRVVIYMRRIRAMIVFSGYLDEVPLWSALPTEARYNASCTMKLLQNFYWDPGTPAAQSLFIQSAGVDKATLNDGGLAGRAVKLLTDVVAWPAQKIHIGAIPEDWYEAVAAIKEEYVTEAELARTALRIGGTSYLSGTTPTANSYSSVEGIGPGTGTLPATSGKISYFAGPGTSDATGKMALTGEPGTAPRDVWYVAMRWPYVNENLTRKPGVDVAAAQNWWRDRRILISSPTTGKAIVGRAADWGPNISTGRVIDVSKEALQALGVSTDSVVHIGFVGSDDKTAQLGPIDMSSVPVGPVAPVSTAGGIPGAITSGWGSRGDASNMVTVTAAGCRFTVHKLCAPKFVGFVNDLKSILGYQPRSIGGFADRNIANSSSTSNHAFGAAIDIDPGDNPRYASPSGGPYKLPKPPEIIQLARKWGLGWGGEYRNSKDYMHFEDIGDPGNTGTNYGPAPAGSTAVTKASKPRMWQPPIKKPWTITAKFGEKGPSWANGHSGTDFANGSSGAQIHPVGPGVVKAKQTLDSSYGNSITIDHGKGVFTFYAHMINPSTLALGSPVDINSTLGQVGETGNITGPHVHLELRLDTDSYTSALGSGGIEKYIQGVGTSAPPRGVTGSTLADDAAIGDVDGTGSIGGEGVTNPLENIGGGLLNVAAWEASGPTQAGLILTGHRALMNDEPVMNTLSNYMGSGFREFCSAPNGDFIGWFPDFYGHFKMAGKMIISPLEISLESPPVIRWGDQNLKTHHFVTGSTTGYSNNSGQVEIMSMSAGIASVEDVRLLKHLLNVTQEEAEAISATTLKRYGARPTSEGMANIPQGEAEFYKACMGFIENWSEQWRTTINVTFMPEMFPGMLACFPVYGIQGYVREVSHSWDYQGGGFNTQISAAPWSSIGDKGPGALPKGAPL